MIEEIIKECLSWVVKQTGHSGEVALFLIVGLSLMLGGPVYMARVNKSRIRAEKKPKYGCLETAIVIAGGIAFTGGGIFLLFWPR